ncbi:hypothetical protein [Planotetraspora silvatica]|uniref:hypothetical protein n=1 Tax=Planotetraspora silvatica TaxID=234614 RepID=UPI001950AEA2|nr:hypothetical protein [Planotetraspora silvatica]
MDSEREAEQLRAIAEVVGIAEEIGIEVWVPGCPVGRRTPRTSPGSKPRCADQIHAQGPMSS